MSSVSAIIPARNNADMIGATLASCLASPTVAEVLVVLHASHDDTAAAVRAHADPRVKLIEDEGRGISRAMNVGLAAATGAHVAKIDADDLVPADRFARQAAFLESRDDMMAVSGRFEAIDGAGAQLSTFATERAEGEVTDAYLAQERPTHFGTWLCRRDGWERVGGFREWFVTAEDFDMPFRLAMVGRVWFLPEMAYSYRVREGSITRTQNDTLRRFYSAQAIRFAQQRRATGTDDLERGAPPALPEPKPGDDEGAGLLECQTVGFLTGRAWREFDAGKVRTGMRTMAQHRLREGRGQAAAGEGARRHGRQGRHAALTAARADASCPAPPSWRLQMRILRLAGEVLPDRLEHLVGLDAEGLISEPETVRPALGTGELHRLEPVGGPVAQGAQRHRAPVDAHALRADVFLLAGGGRHLVLPAAVDDGHVRRAQERRVSGRVHRHA